MIRGLAARRRLNRRRQATRRSSTSIRRPISRPIAGMRRCSPAATPSSGRSCSLQSQASAFNGAGQDLGAALPPGGVRRVPAQERGRARRRSILPMRDVAAAFDQFVEGGRRTARSSLPAHSQGALHLERLLREKVAGKPIAKRVVAAYVVGWPISTAADLPALGLPACAAPDQTGCILSWMSFGEPANPDLILDDWQKTQGLRRRRAAARGHALRQPDHAARRTAPRPPQTIPARWSRRPTCDRRRCKPARSARIATRAC